MQQPLTIGELQDAIAKLETGIARTAREREASATLYRETGDTFWLETAAAAGRAIVDGRVALAALRIQLSDTRII